jgi:hypothetical protein
MSGDPSDPVSTYSDGALLGQCDVTATRLSWSHRRSVARAGTIRGRSAILCGLGYADRLSPMRVLIGLMAVLAATASCSGASGKTSTRAADTHRAASSACPQERGAGISGVPTQCQSSLQAACMRDSDCVAGTNGRCLQALGPACGYYCSYDDCTQDSDCTANAPCACRASSSDTGPNTCATGSDCRVDADCGPGGFCSPSLVGSPCECISEIFCQADSGSSCSETGPDGVTKSVPCSCDGNCGHGYFCHTPKDSCLNDGECASGTCNFDLKSKAWMCTGVICPS